MFNNLILTKQNLKNIQILLVLCIKSNLEFSKKSQLLIWFILTSLNLVIFLLNFLDEKERENTYLTSKYLTFYFKYAIIIIENQERGK